MNTAISIPDIIRRRPQYGISILILYLFLLLNIQAQESLYSDLSQVQGTFWVNRGFTNSHELILSDQIAEPRGDDDYILELLELARQWFSGMIYGYEFVYTPSDEARQVEEIFELRPIHLIPWGDPSLEYLGYYEEDQKIELSFRYLTRDHEQARLRGWRSSTLPNASGLGSVPDRTNLESREESFAEAAKQAIRNYFRHTVPNKPREIRGRLALLAMPRSFADGGRIDTSLRIVIDTDEILQYRHF